MREGLKVIAQVAFGLGIIAAAYILPQLLGVPGV